MLTRDVYRRAARSAAAHLQLSIERVDLPTAALGEARVVGKVERVFHGSDELRGRTLSLNVSCIAAGAAAPPGGTLWTPAAELRLGRVLEAYVSPLSEGYEIARSLSCLLDSVTDTPVMTVHEETLTDAERPLGMSIHRLLWPLGIILALLVLLLAFFRGQ